MHLNKNSNTLVAIIVVIVVLLSTAVFCYRVFSSFIKPLFLSKPKETSNISLNMLLDETATYISSRRDLTVASPSATLTNVEEKFSAEVVNASGISNAARAIAESLEELGITVAKIGNSQPVEESIVSLKTKSLKLRASIVTKISTDSAKVRVETLEETYPFDIRIVIGK